MDQLLVMAGLQPEARCLIAVKTGKGTFDHLVFPSEALSPRNIIQPFGSCNESFSFP